MKTHLSRFHLNPLSFLCILLFNYNMFLILQILFNRATLLARALHGSSSCSGRFIFFSPSDEFVNNSIDVRNEHALCNWMDRASMSISKVDKCLRATKEMYLAIDQALIDVYFKTRSSIAILSASTCMCPSLKNSFIIFASIFLSNHLSPCRQLC
jgi:hypothetical protein